MLGGTIQFGEEGRRRMHPFSGSYIHTATETLIEALQRDIRSEKAAAENYQSLADEIEDPYIKAVLLRIRADEIHHAGLLDGLLKDLNAPASQREPSRKRNRHS